MARRAELLPGTLDLLILQALSLGPLHGYGILSRIEQISGGAFLIEQGALYPALYRLERHRAVLGQWALSETNRRAKFYRLTPEGHRRFRTEATKWHRTAGAMATALRTRTHEG
jgi:PadR family transcriptional regulator PadR